MSEQFIPPAQLQPPAGQPDLPFRPSCNQLVAQPGSVEGWTAWGITLDGSFRQFVGLPSTLSRDLVDATAQSYGVCVVNGVKVPFSTAELAASEGSSAMPQSEQVTPQQMASMPVEDDPIGLMPSLPFPLLVGAAIVAAIAGINWIRENAKKRDSNIAIPPPSLYPLLGQSEDNPRLNLPESPRLIYPSVPSYFVPDIMPTYLGSQRPQGKPNPHEPLVMGSGVHRWAAGGGESMKARNPLDFCPLTLEEFPSEIEVAALTFCCYEDYSQNEALEAIYGFTNSDKETVPYDRAMARWKAFKKQWNQKYNLED